MPISFSADDILEIAQQIEQNGLNFYRAASNAAVGIEANKMLSNLAEWEVAHEKLIRDMRAVLTSDQKQPTVFDPDDEMALYLKAMASKVVFTSKMDPVEMLGSNPSLLEILNIALDRERDAVSFYKSIKEIVPVSMGKDKIEAILLEEVSHVDIITKLLAEI
ncbi:ferritin family protein [uncultured Desulfobulbus sp.]|uniref:ferritin family protein n=1 Tax=uncultured Desulfobulbus sp. TaxID=239745 RepID=UPI0029C7683B|nr:ferritin family protein [uncultured Desulfobulbus sp.]